MSEVELETAPVLTVACVEKEGTIMREVRLGQLTTERMRFLWDKLSQFDTLFNDFTRGDFRAFVDHFLLNINGEVKPAGLIWDVDDVGMFFLNNLQEGISAEAHFLFWDKRFRGREGLCREMLKHAFELYGFRRIDVRVPLYAEKTLFAVERIGLKKEGRLREQALYKDQWFDVNLYSILASEVS